MQLLAKKAKLCLDYYV